MIKIAGICGSLRAASYNRGLLRAAASAVPEGASMTVVEIGDLPLFNEDIEKPSWPEPVMAFRRALWAADAILFVTPEYNAGMPGVLKNAVDWASRFEGSNRSAPDGEVRKTPLQDTPVATMGATPGTLGTARSQAQLRASLLATNIRLMPSPECYVGTAKAKFENGELVDEASRAAAAKVVAGLVAWTKLLKAT